MKGIVSVVGRFHAFDLAKQLKKHNLLYKLNSTYPIFIIKKWGFENFEIKSNFFLEIINRYGKKIFGHTLTKKIVYVLQAKSNRKNLKKTDFIITWSGASLEILKEAKKTNKITILERGSSHYSYQTKILKEEYKLYNKDFIADKWVWERELQEYELADYISIPSTFVKNTFLDYGIPEKKLIVNPYGVDLSSFKKVEKRDEVFRIISAGNLSIRKGSKYLLEAFSELDLVNAEIWHIGSIDDDIKDWLKEYENKKVYFLGHKPQNELFEYYSQGSVYALMTVEDGFAMVLTQAMSCGLPIITTVNSGGPDLITEQGKEGFTIDIRDKSKLKEHLLYLYNNPEILEQMSSAAIDRVSSGFTWDDYGNRYAEFLRQVDLKSI